MNPNSESEVGKGAIAADKGDAKAVDRLMLLVFEEIRRLAASFLRHERPGHTLQTTALVNEVYLRLAKENGRNWKDRTHFLAVAARVMRQVLVNHAVARKRLKRDGKWRRVPLDMVVVSFEDHALDLVGLDEALKKLASFDGQKSRIVELRYFGGLTDREIAMVLKISRATVQREWKVAKAWLRREMLEAEGRERES